MKTFSICGGLLLLAWSQAHAYLGDDAQTLAKRYGKPVSATLPADGSQPLTYVKDGYRIQVEFENGRSVRETFTKPDTHVAFSEDVLQAFLNAHADGKQWNEIERIPGQRNWRREGARALYNEQSDQPRLVISRASQVPGEDYFTRLFTASVLTPLNKAMNESDAASSTPAPTTFATPKSTASNETAATQAAADDDDLAAEQIETGQLSTGQLQTGKLQTGHLQTGKLQTGKLGERIPVP